MRTLRTLRLAATARQGRDLLRRPLPALLLLSTLSTLLLLGSRLGGPVTTVCSLLLLSLLCCHLTPRQVPAAGTPGLRPLLSRDTPLWLQLRSEGLYHESSGYPRLEPEQEREKADLAFWSEKVTREFGFNGTQAGTKLGEARREELMLPHQVAG
jgi:apolipoprotein N-acyltransferase